MWIARFRILDKKNELVKLIKESNLEVFYYPVNNYEKRGRHYFVCTGILKGEEGAKRKFFSELKRLKQANKGRRVEMFEYEKDFFVIVSSLRQTEEIKKLVKVFYNPAVIHLKPAIIYKNGWEEWEIASLEKADINKIIEVGEKIYELELLKFKEEKIKNIGFLNVFPNLTEKQEDALKLALKHGYYNYPRKEKITLDKLAKIAKVSFSTFQAHIKKAENKIMSFAINLRR